jgi:hypothetical protein
MKHGKMETIHGVMVCNMTDYLPKGIAGTYHTLLIRGGHGYDWAGEPFDIEFLQELSPEEKAFEVVGFVRFLMKKTITDTSSLWSLMLRTIVNIGIQNRSARSKAHAIINKGVLFQRQRGTKTHDPQINKRLVNSTAPFVSRKSQNYVDRVLEDSSRGIITAKKALMNLCFMEPRWKKLRRSCYETLEDLYFIGHYSLSSMRKRPLLYKLSTSRKADKRMIKRIVRIVVERTLSGDENPQKLGEFMRRYYSFVSTRPYHSSVLQAIRTIILRTLTKG